jgi:hypothetical protein
MILLSIWARGLVIVTLVSLNTRLLADGRWSAVVVASVLSAVWWLNARTASRLDGRGAMISYALGAGCGTALGLWLGGL